MNGESNGISYKDPLTYSWTDDTKPWIRNWKTR